MSTLHIRYPWIVSIVLAVAFLGLSLVGTPIGNWVEQTARLPVNSGVLVQQFLLVIFSALTVTVFGGWRKAGFDRRVQLRSVLLVLPPLAAPIILLFISGFSPTNPTQIGMLVVFTAMIGFAEEALCRGVMLGAFLPRGAMRAAVISSLIFGSMHLVHLFYGMDLVTALLYVIYASLIGFGFAAPYLRSGGAIWPLVFAHGLYDLLGKLGHGWGAQAQPTSGAEILVRLAVAALVGIYGFWLLRQSKPAYQPGQPAPSAGKV